MIFRFCRTDLSKLRRPENRHKKRNSHFHQPAGHSSMTLLRHLSRRVQEVATVRRPLLSHCNSHLVFFPRSHFSEPSSWHQPTLRSYVRPSPRYHRHQQQQQLVQLRNFHASRPHHVPLIPLPAFLLSAFKTGKFLSFVSLSSRTSLTLLPHSFFKIGKRRLLLASIPFLGIVVLVLVGLDQVYTLLISLWPPSTIVFANQTTTMEM